ncbi:MAG: hypothetical protein AAFO78_09075, partial [Pseudomonadota bacterium]
MTAHSGAFDFNFRIKRKALYRNSCSRGRVLREEGSIGLIHGTKILDSGQKHLAANNVSMGRIHGGQRRADIFQRLSCLRSDTFREGAGFRITPQMTGKIKNSDAEKYRRDA